jgi:hypothetical protein
MVGWPVDLTLCSFSDTPGILRSGGSGRHGPASAWARARGSVADCRARRDARRDRACGPRLGLEFDPGHQATPSEPDANRSADADGDATAYSCSHATADPNSGTPSDTSANGTPQPHAGPDGRAEREPRGGTEPSANRSAGQHPDLAAGGPGNQRQRRDAALCRRRAGRRISSGGGDRPHATGRKRRRHWSARGYAEHLSDRDRRGPDPSAPAGYDVAGHGPDAALADDLPIGPFPPYLTAPARTPCTK